MSKYAAFYAAYNSTVKQGNRQSKEDVVSDFTNGRTASLRNLSDDELSALVKALNGTSGVVEGIKDTKEDKMRKAIISIFHKMNRKPKDAIAWAEKQGVKGRKKPFNEYTSGELYTLIQVAEKVLSDWQLAIRKSL